MNVNTITLKEFGEMRPLSTSYIQLAQVYDRFMSDAPYELWIQYAKEQWSHYQLTPKKVLDLACGTGNISINLAKEGYQVTGIDLSDDMLAVTQDKAQQAGLRLNLFQQDMREFISPEEMDSIVCFCDSLNYITEPDGIVQTFERVYHALKAGGVFLFDVHSLYKIKEVFADQSFNWVEEDLAYMWNCQSEEEEQVSHFLTFFIKEGKTYRRFDESHLQRGYTVEQITSWLDKIGFVNIKIQADFEQSLPKETSERIFFSCQKPI